LKRFNLSISDDLTLRLENFNLFNSKGLKKMIENNLLKIEIMEKYGIDKNMENHIFSIGVQEFLKRGKVCEKSNE
jgi:hypothetical protein